MPDRTNGLYPPISSDSLRRAEELLLNRYRVSTQVVENIDDELPSPTPDEMSDEVFEEHLEHYVHNLMPRSLAETNPKLFKAVMKRRHLHSHERQRLHKPLSDWIETPSGEVCKSAETLVVKDIISKYCK